MDTWVLRNEIGVKLLLISILKHLLDEVLESFRDLVIFLMIFAQGLLYFINVLFRVSLKFEVHGRVKEARRTQGHRSLISSRTRYSHLLQSLLVLHAAVQVRLGLLLQVRFLLLAHDLEHLERKEPQLVSHLHLLLLQTACPLLFGVLCQT